MMGRLKGDQGQLFYEFHLDEAVPEDHLVRRIDSALDLRWLRDELAAHYSSMGRPSIDQELMIRMLVVGYVFAIRSERLICREVQVNLAYRWFCKLARTPDRATATPARESNWRHPEPKGVGDAECTVTGKTNTRLAMSFLSKSLVLIVDHDPALSRGMQRLLRQFGYDALLELLQPRMLLKITPISQTWFASFSTST